MALTQADLDALDSAIAGAELEVEVDGRRIKYRSVVELQAARAHVQSVLNAGSSTGAQRPAFFQHNPTTRRGF